MLAQGQGHGDVTYMIAQNWFFFHANGCILTKLCLFVTFLSLRPFRFLPLPNPQMSGEFAL